MFLFKMQVKLMGWIGRLDTLAKLKLLTKTGRQLQKRGDTVNSNVANLKRQVEGTEFVFIIQEMKCMLPYLNIEWPSANELCWHRGIKVGVGLGGRAGERQA